MVERYSLGVPGAAWKAAEGDDILGLLFLSGCFYNSAWGQRKEAQQHYAERQAAPTLAPEGTAWRSHREVRVRVYADGAYRRAHPDVNAPHPKPAASTAQPHVLSGDIAAADGLSEADQAIYEQPLSSFQSGDLPGAFALAAPLADRNPESYSTQHLACELGVKGAASMRQMHAYCTRLSELSR